MAKNSGKAVETSQQKNSAVDKKFSIPSTRSRSVLSFLSKKKAAASKKDDGEINSTQSFEYDSNTTTTDPVSHAATSVSNPPLVERVSSVPKSPLVEKVSSDSNPTLVEKISSVSKPPLVEKVSSVSKHSFVEKTWFVQEEMQANEFLEIEICLSRGDDTVVSVFSQSMTKTFPGSPMSEVKEQEKVEEELEEHPFLEKPEEIAVVKEAEEQLLVQQPEEQTGFEEPLVQEQREVLVAQETEEEVVPQEKEDEEDPDAQKQENDIVLQKREEDLDTQKQEEEVAQKQEMDLVAPKQEDKSNDQIMEEQQVIQKLAESRKVQKAIVYQAVKKVFTDADTDFISVSSNQEMDLVVQKQEDKSNVQIMEEQQDIQKLAESRKVQKAIVYQAVKKVFSDADTDFISVSSNQTGNPAVKTVISDADTASIKPSNNTGEAKQESKTGPRTNFKQTSSKAQPFEDLLGPIKGTNVERANATMIEVCTAMASLFGHAVQDAFEEFQMLKHNAGRDDIILYSDDDNTSVFSESCLGDNSLCAESQSQDDVEGLVMRVMAKIMANRTLRAQVPEIDHLHEFVKDAICEKESRDDVERVTRDIVSNIVMDRDVRLESQALEMRRMRDKEKSQKAERLIENYDNVIAQITGNQPKASPQKNHKASKSVCTVTTHKRSLSGVKSLLSRQHKYKDSVARSNPRRARGTPSSSHPPRKTADRISAQRPTME